MDALVIIATIASTITVMALVPLGAHVAMGEGMILSPLHNLVERSNLPLVLRKPLTLCPRCMVSVWGTAAALWMGLLPLDIHSLIVWPVLALAAVGLQEAIDK